jgi:hypothetical protein
MEPRSSKMRSLGKLLLRVLLTPITLLMSLLTILMLGIWSVSAFIFTGMRLVWENIYPLIERIRSDRNSEQTQDVNFNQTIASFSTNAFWGLYMVFVYAFAIPFTIIWAILFSYAFFSNLLQRWFVERSQVKHYRTRRDRGESPEDLGAEIDQKDFLPGLKRRLKKELGIEVVETEADVARREQILARQREALDKFPLPKFFKDWYFSQVEYQV